MALPASPLVPAPFTDTDLSIFTCGSIIRTFGAATWTCGPPWYVNFAELLTRSFAFESAVLMTTTR